MTVHQRKVHNYLRITLDYTEGGTVKIRIIYHIDEIIAAFDKAEPRCSGINTIDAPYELYKVDED